MAPILRVVSSEISPRVMIEFLYSIQRGGIVISLSQTQNPPLRGSLGGRRARGVATARLNYTPKISDIFFNALNWDLMYSLFDRP
jgi:hypothetical protein